MNRFEFNLATPKDDAQLRSLLAATPMEGRISIAFAREPSYFAAVTVDGTFVQVGIVRDTQLDRIVGMGSRAISNRYIDQRPVPVGYLGGLRLLPEYRGQAGLLVRGYRFFRRLHADGRTRFYLTTIAEGNDTAKRVLTSGRVGLPVYHPLGRYFTLSIAAASRTGCRKKLDDGVAVRQATSPDRRAIVEIATS